MNQGNIIILPIVRRESHTLDFLEQRDREMSAFVAICHGKKPYRTRPILVIDKDRKRKDAPHDRNAHGDRKRNRGNNR